MNSITFNKAITMVSIITSIISLTPRMSSASAEPCDLYFWFSGNEMQNSYNYALKDRKYLRNILKSKDFIFKGKAISKYELYKTKTEKYSFINDEYSQLLKAKGYNLVNSGEGNLELNFDISDSLNLGYAGSRGAENYEYLNITNAELTNINQKTKTSLFSNLPKLNSYEYKFGTSLNTAYFYDWKELNNPDFYVRLFGPNTPNPIYDELVKKYHQANSPADKELIKKEIENRKSEFRKIEMDPILILINQLPKCSTL